LALPSQSKRRKTKLWSWGLRARRQPLLVLLVQQKQ
jgi:hypothetical protein